MRDRPSEARGDDACDEGVTDAAVNGLRTGSDARR